MIGIIKRNSYIGKTQRFSKLCSRKDNILHIAAQKNLEEERLNLARISDILSELEKQLEPLKNHD